MFASGTHPGKEPEGVSLLSSVREGLEAEGLTDTLVLGVGGIDGDNCGEVAAAGADGVAVIRCLCHSSDPAREARRIVSALSRRMSRAR